MLRAENFQNAGMGGMPSQQNDRDAQNKRENSKQRQCGERNNHLGRAHYKDIRQTSNQTDAAKRAQEDGEFKHVVPD